MSFVLPKRKRGRQSEEAREQYALELELFCAGILQLRSGVDFEVGARGWGYIAESDGLIDKSDFDQVERLINDCRKSGDLPLDIVASDTKRAFDHVDEVDDRTPDEVAQAAVNNVRWAYTYYEPVSFWEHQDYYVQVQVEKATLKGLFSPVCEELHTPIATSSGWSDINQRADMMSRFRDAEADGKQCVLAYCGDHCPGGLRISDFIRSNLEDIAGAVGWHPDNLIIDRFGLNWDFILKHRLTKIDNLITGAKGQQKGICLSDARHPDHFKPYVQEYIAAFGVNKVEGEALVKVPKLGQDLCRDAILKYVDPGGVANYESARDTAQEEARQSILDEMSNLKDD